MCPMHLSSYNRCAKGMDLRHLRAFVAIVDTGGFVRAATRVSLSQPALSRQVRALETELGVRLFDRSGRRVRLTAEGEDLLERGRRLLVDAESLRERARALRSGRTGLLRVGATPQAMETMLAGFLPRYRRRHPGVDVHLVEDGGGRLPARLARGEVSLALMPAGDDRFRWRPLAPLHVLAVLPTRHRLARRAAVALEHLVSEPLLVLRRDFGSRQWFDAACDSGRLRPHLLLESGAPDTLVALARAGYGVAVVPSNTRIAPGGVRAVPIVHRGVALGAWASIAWDPRRFLAPYAMDFVSELVTHARRGVAARGLRGRLPPLPRPPAPPA